MTKSNAKSKLITQRLCLLAYISLDLCHLAMYIVLMKLHAENRIGEIIKQKRILIPLTLNELSSNSGVSQSHIGRIERGERFPSARVLRKIAKPLGFEEEELFMLAGFLSTTSSDPKKSKNGKYGHFALDPLVANFLAQEPPEVQRAVIGILSLLKIIAQATKNESTPHS
jgi:transcriptional regulator with XRE-family HTH domain